MYENERFNINPKQHIRDLFESTKDSKVDITFYPDFDEPYTLTFRMNWTREDAETLAERFETLTDALSKIGKLYDKLEYGDKCSELLTSDELSVWETYIRPFDENFDADEMLIRELNERDDLTPEELELLERLYEWFEEQCLKRLSAMHRSLVDFIDAAKRYTFFVKSNAPELVINDAARRLAEEMALYYFCIGQVSEGSLLDEILSGRREINQKEDTIL